METVIMSIDKDGKESRSTPTIQHKPTHTSLEWADLAMLLRIAAIPDSDSLRVAMTFERYRAGNTYAKGTPEEHEESSGFEAGGPPNPESDMDSQLRDAEFVAVVDPHGQLISADVVGQYWTRRKKELADAVKNGISQAQADVVLRQGTPGVFASIEDAMAYLPPKGVQAGQSWTVRRKYVLPLPRLWFLHAHQWLFALAGRVNMRREIRESSRPALHRHHCHRRATSPV
ncbi:MAG: hypothetical protein HZA50_10535 [Planctomycetes bacterium]|nr:hypothetical protein [Planctomycetota bacterium]